MGEQQNHGAFSRYGLQGNPYSERSLKPLESDEDVPLIFNKNFRPPPDEIRQVLKVGAAQKRPAFILVSVKWGSGKSVAADEIMRWYRELRGVPRSHFVRAVAPGYGHENTRELMREILACLVMELRIAGFALDAIDKLDAASEPGKPINPANLTVILHQLAATLEVGVMKDGVTDRAAFGVIIDKVKSAELVQLATSIFSRSNTLVTFTATDASMLGGEAIKEFERTRLAPSERRVELVPLSGEMVVELVSSRWTGYSPHPFDETTVAGAFADGDHIAGAIQILEALLDNKATSVSPEGKPWPEDQELKLTKQQINGWIRILRRKKRTEW